MSTERSFYLRQVAQCAVDAGSTTLPNQRAIFLRAQSAWQALADSRLLAEKRRARLEAQRQEQMASPD